MKFFLYFNKHFRNNLKSVKYLHFNYPVLHFCVRYQLNQWFSNYRDMKY